MNDPDSDDTAQPAGTGTLAVRHGVMLTVGGMIGAGIFALLGQAGAYAGSATWVSFLISALVVLLLSYTVIKLGIRYPSTGGVVTYVVAGFGKGRLVGSAVLFGWFAAIVIVTAMVAVTFGAFATSLFVGADAAGAWDNVFATAVVVATVVAIGGTGIVARAQTLVNVILLSVFALLCIVTVPQIDAGFLAREHLAVGGRHPRQRGHHVLRVPRLLGRRLCRRRHARSRTRVAPRDVPGRRHHRRDVRLDYPLRLRSARHPGGVRFQETAIAEAARPALGETGFTLVSVAALLATSSGVVSSLFAASKVTAELAEERLFPTVFGRNSSLGPHAGLLITAGLVIVIANLFDLTAIVSVGSAASLAIYLLVALACYRLRAETAGARTGVVIVAIAAVSVVLVAFLVELATDAPDSFVALVVVAVLAVVLDGVRRRFEREPA